jgi:hypothetical protein
MHELRSQKIKRRDQRIKKSKKINFIYCECHAVHPANENHVWLYRGEKCGRNCKTGELVFLQYIIAYFIIIAYFTMFVQLSYICAFHSTG